MPKLSRCATSCPRGRFALGTLRRDLMEQPEGSVHRTAVGKRTRHVRLQQDQVRPCGCLLVVLAPDAALQGGEIILGAEIVTASFRHWVPHIVSAPGAAPAARSVCHEEYAPPCGTAYCDLAIFLLRVIGIPERKRRRVEEHRCDLLERDAVLLGVCRSLDRIPLVRHAERLPSA